MSIFNCVFCSLAYNNIDKKPKILPCGHIFCEKCISSFVNKALNGIICICPLDNKIHKFLNSFQIPICEQIFENIPLSNLSEKEKEISNYINKMENKINIIIYFLIQFKFKIIFKLFIFFLFFFYYFIFI